MPARNPNGKRGTDRRNPPPRRRPTLNIAHRGGAALAPENTLEACRLAVATHRADMIEADLQLTRDGELVVSHDATLERCTDASGPISDLTRAQLAAVDAGYRFTPDGGRTFPFRGKGVRVPTLRELLRELPSTPLNLDLKPDDPALAALLAQVLRDAGAVARVCCGSKHDRVAAKLLGVLPEGRHFFPRQVLTELVRAVQNEAPLPPDLGFRVLDMPLALGPTRLVTPRLVQVARERDLDINVWTVDEPGDMEELADLGVDGIMTNRPDLLRRVLDERSS